MLRTARVCALLLATASCASDTQDLEGSGDACRVDSDCANGEVCAFTSPGCAHDGVCTRDACDDTTTFTVFCGCRGDRTFGDATCSKGSYTRVQTNATPCEGVVLEPDGGPPPFDGGPRDGGPRDGGPVPCSTTADCGAFQICEYAEGSCGMLGACRDLNTCIGDAAVATLCGCDGVTFTDGTFCIDRPFSMFGACPGQRDGGPDSGVAWDAEARDSS